jgi:hypothetical protein
MLILLSLVFAAGMAPLAAAIARLKPGRAGSASWPPPGSVLLATLAFNLTFFWQELWLAIPKALTPGLWPVLYHNDHDWAGSSPTAELLQGTGAVATMVSGLAFTAILASGRKLSSPWRLFAFWMAVQGLFQSLSQFAIGAVVPGNDVGRALAYLRFGFLAHAVVLVVALAAMSLAGRALASLGPAGLGRAAGTRRAASALGATAVALVLLSVPFRVPRDPVEVIVIPALVNLIGTAWLLLGMTLVTHNWSEAEADPPAVFVPAAMLIALLIFFQAYLRPGISL